MATLVLSLIGTDRTGLVESVAELVALHGGNWERSHLTELAGVFAGVALVTVPDGHAEAFREGLDPLRQLGVLDVRLMDAAASGGEQEEVAFELTGNDRPGIVREVSHLLAELGVGIVDLQTWTDSAAMAGGILFHAEAVVRLPAGLTTDGLVGQLEQLADELMVDISPTPR